MRAAAAALLLASCVVAACATARTGSGLADDLLAADRAFAARSAATTTADAFAAFVAADGLQLPAQGEPIRGRDAIVDGIRAGPPSRLLWTPMQAEVSADGSLGWTWGEWRAYAIDDAERPQATGRYVNVWKRQPDGTWKVRVDLGNVARPAAQ